MKKKTIGIVIFILLILIIIGIKFATDDENIVDVSDKIKNLTKVTIAVGGGKEDFIADERVNQIMKEKYGIEPIYDSWSNGKMIVNPLTRKDGSSYDLMFCSNCHK